MAADDAWTTAAGNNRQISSVIVNGMDKDDDEDIVKLYLDGWLAG